MGTSFPQRVTIESALANTELSSSVHPAVLQLGLRYADGSIRGGNARCVAMLTTFRKVIQVPDALPVWDSTPLRVFSVPSCSAQPFVIHAAT